MSCAVLDKPFSFLSRTAQGGRKENQDACGHWQDAKWLMGVVADGAGGHQAGRLASATAVHELLRQFRLAPSSDLQRLLELVRSVNSVLLDKQQADSACSDMHTTLVAVVVNKQTQQAVRLHVGDSRLYLLSQAGISCLTEDHRVGEAGGHALYSALGEPNERLRIDVEVFQLPTLQFGLLLCTDGFWEVWRRHAGGFSLDWPFNEDRIAALFEFVLGKLSVRSDNLSLLALFSEVDSIQSDRSKSTCMG